MKNKTIAIDADGVMLDYNLAYAKAWEKVFGIYPKELDPHAYLATDRWGVSQLSGPDLNRFREAFDESFWTSVPMLPGALDACTALYKAGYTLICVTAILPEHADFRLRNLHDHGVPIEKVIATGTNHYSDHSPKASALLYLQPLAFVDDYLPYMRGVHSSIHKALISRGSEKNNPNLKSDDLHLFDTHHDDLLAFSKWWLDADKLDII